MTYKERFGLRLSAERVYSGMTQQDLARRIGSTKSAISMYENGRRSPKLETLSLICQALDCTADMLLPAADMPSTEVAGQMSIDDLTGVGQ